MKSPYFGTIWTFILATALFDSYFAWQYREALASWEQNPVARWAAENLGLIFVFWFKFLGLAFAMSLAVYCRVRRNQVYIPLTITIGVAYAILAFHYTLGYRQTINEQFAILTR